MQQLPWLQSDSDFDLASLVLQQLPLPDEQQQVPALRAATEHPQPLAAQDIRPSGSRQVLNSTKI